MRPVLVVLGMLLLVGGLASIKVAQLRGLVAFGKQAEKAGPRPESVGTDTAETETWQGTLAAVGSITAVKGVAVSNDSPGVVTRIAFESGATVPLGKVLVELDTSVERAQLASAQSRLDLAALTATRSRALVKSGAIAQAQLDADESQLSSATTDVGALKSQIDRKIVRAPFAGRLGIRSVNVGQYLAPGTAVTVLEAIGAVFVDFTLPQQRLPDVHPGMTVRVAIASAGEAGAPLTGTITAVDPAVDATTRTIKLRASVPNAEETLRPGMFANVTVELPQHAPLVVIPVTGVVHASYGDSVFVLEDKKPGAPGPDVSAGRKPVRIARQQFVRTGESRGDFVAIMDGVTAGQEVVTAGAFKLHNGSPVVVDNRVKAAPRLEPRPENR